MAKKDPLTPVTKFFIENNRDKSVGELSTLTGVGETEVNRILKESEPAMPEVVNIPKNLIKKKQTQFEVNLAKDRSGQRGYIAMTPAAAEYGDEVVKKRSKSKDISGHVVKITDLVKGDQ
jgi:hypothetical protein